MPQVEIVSLAAVGASMLVRFSGVSSGEKGIMFSFSILSAVYYLSAFKPREALAEERPGFVSTLTENVMPKVLWMGSAVAVIGLQFFFLNLPGYTMMIMIGSTATQLGVALYIILSLINPAATQKHASILYRAVPLLLVATYVHYFIVPLHPEPSYR